MIKAIVFDIWDTAAKKPYSILKKLMAYFNMQESYEESLPRYERSVQLREWKDNEDMVRSFMREFNIEPDRDGIRKMLEIMKHAASNAEYNPGMKELIISLKGNYHVVGFSNTSRIQYEEGNKRLGLNRTFDHIILSYHTGHIKPEKKAFKAMLRTLRLKEDEIVYIDDSEKNCSAASAMGITAILFKDAESLKIELKNLGIRME